MRKYLTWSSLPHISPHRFPEIHITSSMSQEVQNQWKLDSSWKVTELWAKRNQISFISRENEMWMSRTVTRKGVVMPPQNTLYVCFSHIYSTNKMCWNTEEGNRFSVVNVPLLFNCKWMKIWHTWIHRSFVSHMWNTNTFLAFSQQNRHSVKINYQFF